MVNDITRRLSEYYNIAQQMFTAMRAMEDAESLKMKAKLLTISAKELDEEEWTPLYTIVLKKDDNEEVCLFQTTEEVYTMPISDGIWNKIAELLEMAGETILAGNDNVVLQWRWMGED